MFRGDFVVGSSFESTEVDFTERIDYLDRAGPLTGKNPGALYTTPARAGVNGRERLPAESGVGQLRLVYAFRRKLDIKGAITETASRGYRFAVP